MVRVYAWNVRVGGGGGGPKGAGFGDRLLPNKEKKSFKCYCLEWHTSTGMTAKYGIYFHFFCKQGVLSSFGVEWVGEGPDITLIVLF